MLCTGQICTTSLVVLLAGVRQARPHLPGLHVASASGSTAGADGGQQGACCAVQGGSHGLESQAASWEVSG